METNIWLNIITALGTLGAVIVSLFLSGKETRNKRKQDIEDKKKLKHIIKLSLSNIVSQLDRYSETMKKAMLEFPMEQTQSRRTIRLFDQTPLVISDDAYHIVTKELIRYRNRDYEYIMGQLDVLRKIDLNVLSIDLIVTYHSSYTAVANLEQWLSRVDNTSVSTEDITNIIIGYLDSYLNPIKNILNDLEE